jgi:hypothetical protein
VQPVVSRDAAPSSSAEADGMFARALRWLIGPLTFDARACPACWRHAVEAVEWRDAAGDRRIVSLRCGACGHSDQRVLTSAQAQRFERRLMSAWVGEFVAALRKDLIGVDDFERSLRA